MKRRDAGVIGVSQALGVLGVLGGLGGPAAVALTGCGGTAVLIARDASGGIIGLDGDREQAIADARRLMSEACGGVYTILAEREAVAGMYHGRALRERQIRYACGEHPAAPAPAAPHLDDR